MFGCGVVREYSVHLSRQAVLAEIGTELQGTWANTIGRGAAKAVEDIFEEYLSEHELGKREDKYTLKINNGWIVKTGSEPDVEFFDAGGTSKIAIEIKGSLDKAGAQTRYGEARKSFGKALRKNPRCHTIYLASCFTDAVLRQIEHDAEVREWFNLNSILYNDDERNRFFAACVSYCESAGMSHL